MTRQQIQELFVNDPQKLIDDAVVFNFNEVEGDVVVINGVAAGGPWIGFKFLTGQLKGKKIYCQASDIYEVDEIASFEYSAHCSDDGMLFNKDPQRFDPTTMDDWGGDYLPILDGEVFTVKENN